MDDKEKKKRTLAQNRALHLLFGQIADALNESGWDMKRTLKDDVDIPWDTVTVKEYIWRPIQQAQLMKSSTADLNTREIDTVFDTVNRHLAKVTGVSLDFPNIDSLLHERQANEHG